MRKVFLNGKFVDESEAKISIYDSALMFGDMVFEMTRSFNKNHFFNKLVPDSFSWNCWHPDSYWEAGRARLKVRMAATAPGKRTRSRVVRLLIRDH